MAKTKTPITRRHIPVAKITAANPDQPVNSRQIAEHLQITTRTLAAWRADNKIPYWKINDRNFRYRIRDVETALSLAR
jgi:antitoxin (DNA-binding transcriptional repressor) of toxin-antitoxin stability system